MSKLFTQVFDQLKERNYSQGGSSLALLLSFTENPNHKITPIFNHFENGTDGGKYNISRRFRLKSKKVADPQDRTIANQTTILNAHDRLEWDTIVTQPSELRQIGIHKSRFGNRDDLDISLKNGAYDGLLMDQIGNTTETRIEAILSEIISNTPAENIKELSTTNVWGQLSDEVREVRLLRDKYKSISKREDITIIAHPELVDKLAYDKGILFRNETPVFGTGLTTQFSVNTTPVLEIDCLNAFDVTINGTLYRAAALIIDRDGFVYGVDSLNEQPLQTLYGTEEFIGVYYSDVYKLIDTKRVRILYFPASKTTKSDPVNN